MLRALRRDIDLLTMVGIGLILIVGLAMIGGCATQAEAFRDNSTHVYPGGGAHSAALGSLVTRVNTVSWIGIGLGAIGFVLSFWGPLKPFIDTKLALICLAVGFCLPIVTALVIEPLAEHLTFFRWVVGVIVAGGLVLGGYPIYMGLRNKITHRRCLGCPAGGDAAGAGGSAAPAPVAPAQEDGA